MIKCSETPGFEREKCHDDESIKDFTTHLMMTQYFLSENINFKDKTNLGKRPVKAENKFY